jgi:hypothetical protein
MGAEVGGGIELGEFSLGAIAALGASVNSLAKEMDRIKKEQDAYQYGAIEVRLGASSVSAASGNLVIDLGGPGQFRLWEVKRLTVGGGLWTDTVAGQALVVVSSSNPSGAPALTDVADQESSLPAVASYGTRQLVVRHPQRLFVVFVTPTATTQYAAGGAATDFPDKPLRIRTDD